MKDCNACNQTRENCECHIREDIAKDSGLMNLIRHEQLKAKKRTHQPYVSNNRPILAFIVAFICLLFLLGLCGCANYQVVQEVQVNMYHLQNPKNGNVEIIVTKDKLEIGKYYNLKNINKIEIEKGD